MVCEAVLLRSPAMSASLAKSVSWSANRADFLDSKRRTSSSLFCTSNGPCKKEKIKPMRTKCHILYASRYTRLKRFSNWVIFYVFNSCLLTKLNAQQGRHETLNYKSFYKMRETCIRKLHNSITARNK